MQAYAGLLLVLLIATSILGLLTLFSGSPWAAGFAAIAFVIVAFLYFLATLGV